MSTHFTILRDTSSILFVNKPPNIPFHNSDTSLGAVTLLRHQLGPIYPRIYPVHRLDAMTSGAMMFAKSPEIAREVIQQFRTRKVSKYYIAISARKPSKKMGSVIGDMARSRRGSWMLQRTTDNPAITRFITAAIPGSPGKTTSLCKPETEKSQLQGAAISGRPDKIAFLIKPETGKSHQIRVALKSLGAPILGDVRYANALDAEKEARGYLHCAALRLFIGDTLHQVVCPPVGLTSILGEEKENEESSNLIESEFDSEGFKQLFETWFPPKEIEHETGVWFAESKLLRSTPESLRVSLD